MASLVISDHTVLRFTLRSIGSTIKSQRKENLVQDLPSLIMLLDISSITPKGLLPHAVTVARLATKRPTVSSWSIIRPKTISSMRGYLAWWRMSSADWTHWTRLPSLPQKSRRYDYGMIRSFTLWGGVHSPKGRWVCGMPRIRVPYPRACRVLCIASYIHWHIALIMPCISIWNFILIFF